MGDSDKILEFLIQLKVIGKEDAVAVKDLFSETKGAAGDLNQTLPASWEGMDKYKQALGAAGEGSEHLTLKTRALREMMAGAGPVAGELGRFLKLALEPEFLFGAVAAGALELYFHWQEKCAQKQREMIEGMAKLNEFQRQLVADGGNMYDRMFKIAEATADARAQMRSLTEDLKDFEERAKVFDLAQNDALANRIEMRKAESGILQEQIQLLEGTGKISKADAEQDKIKADHQEKLAAIQDKVTQTESDYQSAKSDYNEQLNMAGGPGAFSPEAIGAASGAAYDAQAKLKQDEDAIRNGPANLAAIDAQKQANIAAMKTDSLHWNDYVTANLELVKKRQTTTNEINAAQASVEPDRNAAKEAAQTLTALQSLREKFAALSANLDILHQKMTDAAAAAPGQVQTENQRAALESVTTAMKGGATPGSMFNDAVSAMFTLNHLKEQTGFSPQDYLTKGNPQQQAWIQHLQGQAAALSTLETALGNNGNNVLAAINSLTKMAGSSSAAFQETVNYAQGLEIGINTLRQKIGAMPSQQY